MSLSNFDTIYYKNQRHPFHLVDLSSWPLLLQLIEVLVKFEAIDCILIFVLVIIALFDYQIRWMLLFFYIKTKSFNMKSRLLLLVFTMTCSLPNRVLTVGKFK